MRIRMLYTLASVLPLALATFGCDEEDDGADDSADDHTDDSADSGDQSDHGSGTDGSDPDTTIDWNTPPEATISADTDVEVSFEIHTTGTLHIAEVRACSGEVTDCGLESSDESFTATTKDDHVYTAAINLSAGEWTVVAYAHVGLDPHISEAVLVTAE